MKKIMNFFIVIEEIWLKAKNLMKATYKMLIKQKDMKIIMKETTLLKNQIFLIEKLHKDFKKKTGEILKYHRI
jgi:hypothetical protein